MEGKMATVTKQIAQSVYDLYAQTFSLSKAYLAVAEKLDDEGDVESEDAEILRDLAKDILEIAHRVEEL